MALQGANDALNKAAACAPERALPPCDLAALRAAAAQAAEGAREVEAALAAVKRAKSLSRGGAGGGFAAALAAAGDALRVCPRCVEAQTQKARERETIDRARSLALAPKRSLGRRSRG